MVEPDKAPQKTEECGQKNSNFYLVIGLIGQQH
jgi:hypothetical protein